MGWQPQIRKHTRKNRRPWYTIQISGREHHLGTDTKTAYHKASQLLGGGPANSNILTVAGLCNAYMQIGHPEQWQLARWVEYAGKTRLTDLAPGDLQKFATWLVTQQSNRGKPLSAWTIRHYIKYARQCWLWGYRQEIVACKPDPAKTAKPMIRPRDIPITKLRETIERLNPHARALVEFIVSTGCRPGEARLLRWADIDLDRGVCVLTEHKTASTGRPRTIYLTDAARDILVNQPHNKEHVFLSRTGKPYTKDGLHSVLSRAGIKSAYSLRHTFAQWFLDHGGENNQPGDVKELQAWLGHSSGQMVDIYAQVRDRRLRSRARQIKGPL